MMVEECVCVSLAAEKYVTWLTKSQGLAKQIPRKSGVPFEPEKSGQEVPPQAFSDQGCRHKECGTDVRPGCLEWLNGLSVFHRCVP